MIAPRLPNHGALASANSIIGERKERQKNGFKKDFFYNKFDFWLILATIFISIISFLVFYFSGNKNLADYDAIARLNIARKIIDSLTPGFAQLGGIWLPFPQVLFLPFIWNKFLWHSGLAGAIPSMIAFIISAVFLYKTVYIITKNRFGGILAWFVYVTNINILFLQTMAMSESFFLFTLVMIVYFLTKWAKTKNILHLLYAAVFVILTTLTRYEGYALFGAATLSVGAVSAAIYSLKNKQKIQGVVIFFVTLAVFGILLWSFYSFLIFKDPIYWLNLYTGKKLVIAVDPVVTVEGVGAVSEPDRNIKLFDALKIYSTAMLFINGIIISLLAAIAFLYLCALNLLNVVRRKLDVLLTPIFIMTFCVFGFLIVGYSKGLIPKIETPMVTFANILNKNLNFGSSSNIRYGIITLPLMAVMIGLVYGRNKLLTGIVFGLIIFQLYTLFATPFLLTFSLPKKAEYLEFEYSKWFRENYDGGLILVSAHRHENFMFQTKLSYNNFIYEGSRKWWRNSLTDPTRHATWVVLDENLSGDALGELLENKELLYNNFEVVYSEGNLKIYKKL